MLRINIRKVVLCPKAPYTLELLFTSMTFLSRSFLRIVKYSSIHRFQLGFVEHLIATIGLICLTTLKVMQVCKYMSYAVDLKCCSEWAANESDFCTLLRGSWTLDK